MLLAGEASSYVLFVLSFAIIGIRWLNHHRLVILLGISVVPFTTALLGRYLTMPGAPPASIVYGVVWTLHGIAYALVLGYAERSGLAPKASTPAERRVFLLSAIGPFGDAVGAAISYVSIPLAIAGSCLVVAAYLPPYGRRAKPPA